VVKEQNDVKELLRLLAITVAETIELKEENERLKEEIKKVKDVKNSGSISISENSLMKQLYELYEKVETLERENAKLRGKTVEKVVAR
jgi:cell shape-determining protein MreC